MTALAAAIGAVPVRSGPATSTNQNDSEKAMEGEKRQPPATKPAAAQRRRGVPTLAERIEITKRISMQRLMCRGAPGLLDWRGLASRLADELAAMKARLSALPSLTPADQERLERADGVLRDFEVASSSEAE